MIKPEIMIGKVSGRSQIPVVMHIISKASIITIPPVSGIAFL